MYENKDRENYFANTKTYQSVSDLLSESEKAIREGNSQYAYELSLKATQSAPEHIEAWLLRATLAPSLEERLICVNRLNELRPDHRDRYNVAFFALEELLEKDPFLAYLEETDTLYRVINADRMVLSIPKKRIAANSVSLDQSDKLKAAHRFLIMAMLGLMLAGLGTLIFAPLAAMAAIQGGQSALSRADQVNSTVVLILAVLLFMVGAIFSLLLTLHWTG